VTNNSEIYPAVASRRERLARTVRYHRAAFGVGVLFLLLSLIYNITVPIWEADNEWSHFLYVRHLITHKTAPDGESALDLPAFVDQCTSGQDVLESEARHQFRQPPLYYVGAALATAWIDTSQGWSIAANPFRLRDPQNLGRNFALHSDAERFPYSSVTLAIHVLRLYSGVIGLAGLVAAYLLGLLLFGGRRELALAVMALNAFIPQYVFSASTLNNDILVGALGAWCVYFSLRAIYRRSDWVALAASWLFAGLAVAAKYNGLILFPLVLAATGVLLLRSLRQRLGASGALWTLLLAAGLVITLLLVGLWSVRNLETYSLVIAGYPLTLHPAALAAMLVNPVRNLPAELHYSSVTFWGLMGWGTLPLPDWVIALLIGVTGICLVGVALFLGDRRENRQLRLAVLLLVAFVALGWFVVGIKDITAIPPRGRYLLPAFSTVSFLLILGSKKLLPSRFELAGRWLFIASLLVLTSAAPLFLIKPAYATPVLAKDADLLPGEQAAHVTFGDFAELIGYRIEPERVQIGDAVEVTLVWRARQETANNYVVSMELLDTNQFLHAGVATHPGHGNYPTSRWRAGDVFRDTYELRWNMLDWEWWPGAATLRVQLYCAGPDLAPMKLLDAADQFGASLGPRLDLGRIKIMQDDEKVSERSISRTVYRFGNELALEDYWLTQALPGLGSKMGVGLVWRALTQPSSDYAVQIRVVDEQGRQVAGDPEPAPDPEYPVDLWDASEQVVQMHEFFMPLRLPAGTYRVHLSVHVPQTGQPVRLWGPEADSAQDSYVELYGFEVKEALTNYSFLPLIRVEKSLLPAPSP
jgi:4-amino-4-deoxy-L-arabinose transferase-like glycosyltransferase